MSCIKGSNPFVSAKQLGHLFGGFFVRVQPDANPA